MKRVWMTLLVSLCLILYSGSGFAQGDPTAGKRKASKCASCHGPQGNETRGPQFPRLAGQHQNYLVQALKDYRSGDRQNPIMNNMASGFSNQDIQDLAAYFASQGGLYTPSAKAD